MNRSLILFLIMLLLGGLAFYLVKNNENNKGGSSINMPDRNFAVENKDDIYEIRIRKALERKPRAFVRKDDGWYLDGETLIAENYIENILSTVSRLKIDHIPKKAANKSIYREVRSIGIHIEIFDKSGERIRSYHVAGNTPKEDGTYFLMDGYTQPYVMTLPMFGGSLRDRFQFKSSEIRDRYIFKHKIKDISSVQMDFYTDKNSGFKIMREGEEYRVEATYSKTPKIDRPVNQKLAETFFKEFGKIASESIENENLKRDSITSLKAFSKITVTLTDGEEQSLTLFPLNDIIDPDMKTVDVEMLKKVERYFGESNWGDFYLIQHRLIKGVMRPYSYFFR